MKVRRLAAIVLPALLCAAAALFPASLRAAGKGADAPAPLAILAPHDNATLPAGPVLLIGRLAPGGMPLVRVEVDGKVATFAAARKGAFQASLDLPAGRHTIALAAGNRNTAIVLNAGNGGTFRYHPGADRCQDCHAPSAEGHVVPAPQESACRPCHPGKDRGRFVHGPLGAGNCTGCHDPHGSPLKGLQKSEKRCFSCHEPFPGGKFVHTPAADGRCTGCHDPHSSDYPAHLVREGNVLCAGCHEAFHANHRKMPARAGSMTAVPDDFPRNGDDLACSGCHVSHRSQEKQLLKGGQEQLCKRCHRA